MTNNTTQPNAQTTSTEEKKKRRKGAAFLLGGVALAGAAVGLTTIQQDKEPEAPKKLDAGKKAELPFAGNDDKKEEKEEAKTPVVTDAPVVSETPAVAIEEEPAVSIAQTPSQAEAPRQAVAPETPSETPAETPRVKIPTPAVPKEPIKVVTPGQVADPNQPGDGTTDTPSSKEETKTETIYAATDIQYDEASIYGGETVLNQGANGSRVTTLVNGQVTNVQENPAINKLVSVGVLSPLQDAAPVVEGEIPAGVETVDETTTEVIPEETGTVHYVDDASLPMGQLVPARNAVAGSRTYSVVTTKDATTGQVYKTVKTENVAARILPKIAVVRRGVGVFTDPVMQILRNNITRQTISDIVDFNISYINDDTMLITDEPIVETRGVNGYTKTIQVISVAEDGTETIISTETEIIAPVDAVVRRGTRTATTPVATTFRVTFVDADGNTIDTQVVNEGEDAVAPEAPQVDGKTFTGWSSSLTNIREDKTIKALYSDATATEYDVVYEDALGNRQTTKTVNGEVSLPVLAKEGHDFKGWEIKDASGNVVSGKAVTGNVTAKPIFAIKQFNITFVNGASTSVTANYGSSVDLPEAPAVEGKVFVGWVDGSGKVVTTISNVKADATYTAKYEAKTSVVTFKALDGSVLATKTVAYGEAVDASDVTAPAVSGKRFVKWSKDLSNVTADMEVVAEYADETRHVVRFLAADGSVISTESVETGKGVRTPKAPTIVGKTFIGWGGNTSSITADVDFTAQYKTNTYAVVFVAEGKEISSQTIEHGKAAKAPTAPSVEGKTFKGWSTGFDNVTGALRIVAKYETNTYPVTFVDASGKVLHTTRVAHGEVATLPTKADHGFDVAEWDYSGEAIKGAKTIRATKLEKHVVVTFDVDGVKTAKTVVAGQEVSFPTPTAKTGYTFVRWSTSAKSFNADTTVTAIYEQNSYNVVFKDGSRIIATKSVKHGEGAQAPSAPVKAGYRFVKWDKSFNNVTGNLEVNAVYEKVVGDVTIRFEAVDANGISIRSMGSKSVKDGSTVASSQFVTPATIEGYTFVRWEKTSVTAADGIVVKAIYSQNQYSVKVKNASGDVVETLTRTHGQKVTPKKATKTGHTLTHYVDETGKNVGLNDISVTKDTVLTPVFRINTYTVKYFDANKKLIKTETVEHGKAGVAPKAPVVSGKRFVKWSKDVSNVTTDLNVYAEYEEVKVDRKVKVTYVVEKIDADTGEVTRFVLKNEAEMLESEVNTKAPSSFADFGAGSDFDGSDTYKSWFEGFEVAGWKKVVNPDGSITMKADLGAADGFLLARADAYAGGFRTDNSDANNEQQLHDQVRAYRYRQDFADELLRLMNEHRRSLGLAEFTTTTNQILNDATATRALQLMYKFSHNQPDNTSSQTMFKDGYKDSYKQRATGENIASIGTRWFTGRSASRIGTQVFRAWETSEFHKAEMENDFRNVITISVIESNNGIYAIMNTHDAEAVK